MPDLQLGSDDSEELRGQFRSRFSRQEIATRAEALLKWKTESGGSCFTFALSYGGLIGHTIRRLLVEFVEPSLISDDLICKLIADYEFAADWVPPRLLVREALAHAVHLRWLIERLRHEVGGRSNFEAVIERAAMSLPRADAAFLLNDKQVDELIEAPR